MASASIVEIDGMDYIQITDTSLGRRLQYAEKIGKYTQEQWLQAHNEVMQDIATEGGQNLTDKKLKEVVFSKLNPRKKIKGEKSIKTVLTSYLSEFCQAEIKSKTAIERAQRQCYMLLDFLEKNSIFYYSQLKRDIINKYIEWRKNNRIAGGDKIISADTRNQELRRLASLIQHGIKYHGWQERYLTEGIRVKFTKDNTKSIRPFEISEIKSILGWLRSYSERVGSWYLHDMALLSVCTGLEAKALNLLAPDWVKSDMGILRVYDKLVSGVLDAKTQNRARDIPLTPTLRKIFKRGYVFNRPEHRRGIIAVAETPINHYSQKAFESCEKDTGIVDVNWHRFRHTCATARLSAGWQLVRVSRMLGHSSINTTAVHYAEYDLSASPAGFEGMLKVYGEFVEWLDAGYFEILLGFNGMDEA